MKTNKATTQYIKENRFSVYSFVSDKRSEAIISCDIFTAFHFIAKNNAQGKKTILIAETSIGSLDRLNHEVIQYETVLKERVPYHWMKRYECVYNDCRDCWEPAFR